MNKIHGHTSIILKSKHGLVERIESENVFQSAVIAKYMRSLGYIGSRLTDYSWKNILGGILLFRDAITEGSQYMPAGNQMIGNGAYEVVNNDTPVELGSYNSTESVEGSSAITQVYDFTTAQANGTISCVCLTSATGGYIGYGNASGGVHSTLKDFYNTRDNGGRLESCSAFRNNMNYSFSVASGILTVTKTYLPIIRSSIRNTMTSTVTIDLTAYDFGTGSSMSLLIQDGQYFYFGNGYEGVAPGGTLTYWKYDLDADTVTKETLTNSGALAFNTNNICGIAHGKMCANITGGAYLFDMATSTLVKEFDISPSTIARFTDGLICVHATQARFYDISSSTLYPTNGIRSPQWGTAYLSYEPTCDVIKDMGYNNSVNIASNPLYLATINNLQTPVTKDATRTMKVIYRLEEV